MKKNFYALIMMAAALSACGLIGLPEEPQEYPYSKIKILGVREGCDTAEDEDDDEYDFEGYTNLFDGNYLNKWCSVEDFGGSYEERVSSQGGFDYIIWKTESKIVLSGYMLTTGNDTEVFPGRNWKTWTICGANFASDRDATYDATGWTLIQRIENDNVLQATNNTDYFYEVSGNNIAYQYYRLVIEAIQSTTDNVQQMSEMTLYTKK